MKLKSHKVLDCVLIKVEKLFNQSSRERFYYNLVLDGMEEPLLVLSDKLIGSDIIEKNITYRLNKENEVFEFDIV